MYFSKRATYVHALGLMRSGKGEQNKAGKPGEYIELSLKIYDSVIAAIEDPAFIFAEVERPYLTIRHFIRLLYSLVLLLVRECFFCFNFKIAEIYTPSSA